VPVDARTETKTYLEAYLSSANLTRDNNATGILYIVAVGKPDYPVTKVFKTKGIDGVFAIGEPRTTALLKVDRTPYGYHHKVPIVTQCIDKVGITGAKLKHKMKSELQRIADEYPLGSQRSLDWIDDADEDLGTTKIYGDKYVLDYRTDTI